MRKIDNWLGKVLVPLSACFCRITQFVPGNHYTKEVVVCKFFGPGSILMSIPLLRALKDAGYKIIFLSFERNLSLLKSITLIDEPVTVRTDNFLVLIADTLKMILTIRRRKSRFFLDLEFFSNYTAIIAALSGVQKRIGFYSVSKKRAGIVQDIVPYNKFIHIIHNYLVFSRYIIGEKYQDYLNSISDKSILNFNRDNKTIEQILRNTTRKYSEQFIVFAPFPSQILYELKIWPQSYWATLADSIWKTQKIPILITGKEENKIAAQHIIQNAETLAIFNVCGEFELESFMALVNKAHVVISVDSFPFHLASFLNRKTIGLFGPESPTHYGNHQNAKTTKVLYKQLYCSPCINIYAGKVSDINCTDNVCLKTITPNEVMEDFLQLIS